MKKDEAIYIAKLLAFVVAVLLVTYPLWYPLFMRNLTIIKEFWK